MDQSCRCHCGSPRYLDGRGGAGERDEGACGFVLDGWAGRLQQVVDAADAAGTLGGVGMANLGTHGD